MSKCSQFENSLDSSLEVECSQTVSRCSRFQRVIRRALCVVVRKLKKMKVPGVGSLQAFLSGNSANSTGFHGVLMLR